MGRHCFYMQRALELARKAKGRTSPNPMVGALLVQNEQIMGEGYHARAGAPHAEAIALEQAGDRARGADLYVTLEPCCHWGRQPPCTDAVIRTGVRRVFMAMVDPDPRVAGKGCQQLQEAGIEVIPGVLEAEARQLNEAYTKYMTTGQPFVILKAAMSLDGKIATASGESQWITSHAAREYAHRIRDVVDGILVGIGTVLADDPSLTTRIPGGRDAARIILDSRARLPLSAKLCHLQSEAPTLLATTRHADLEHLARLESCGIEVLMLPEQMGRVDLHALMQELGQRELCSMLIEGGSTVHGAVLSERIVDKIFWFIAPRLIGGDAAPGPVGGEGIHSLQEAIQVTDLQCESVGEDWLFTGYLRYSEAVRESDP